LHVSASTLSAVFKQQRTEADDPDDVLGGRRRGACPSEEREQCRLLRCIFGNPFRRAAIGAGWRTATVLALARSIYADRAFDQLPILADALEDTGCTDADLLGHLRGPGPHVRGCWALDLLLGKE
jgi:hypothetical protein